MNMRSLTELLKTRPVNRKEVDRIKEEMIKDEEDHNKRIKTQNKPR